MSKEELDRLLKIIDENVIIPPPASLMQKIGDLIELDIFIQRMKSVGINIKLISNVPWIYIREINGRIVTEKFQGNHGFTIGWYPRSKDEKFMFTDIKEIFKLIRKYIKQQ